jgi:hypothetical protein
LHGYHWRQVAELTPGRLPAVEVALDAFSGFGFQSTAVGADVIGVMSL